MEKNTIKPEQALQADVSNDGTITLKIKLPENFKDVGLEMRTSNTSLAKPEFSSPINALEMEKPRQIELKNNSNDGFSLLWDWNS